MSRIGSRTAVWSVPSRCLGDERQLAGFTLTRIASCMHACISQKEIGLTRVSFVQPNTFRGLKCCVYFHQFYERVDTCFVRELTSGDSTAEEEDTMRGSFSSAAATTAARPSRNQYRLTPLRQISSNRRIHRRTGDELNF